MTGTFLVVENVASLLGIKPRTVHELTRTRRIPHRVLPHGRRCLFEAESLRAWADGAELEEVLLPGNGRVVRLKGVA
jgi:excisionase family DNA binding protein